MLEAVESGVGLAGCHGGMCDAFRTAVRWQFMTGGQFVSHPGGAQMEYQIEIKRGAHPIVEGLEDFSLTSEQYYMHIDPAVHVLATTRFPNFNGPHTPNGPVEMPVAWSRDGGPGGSSTARLGTRLTWWR